MKFEIANHQVLVDGQPRQIFSGAIHYFRTLPEQWESRLLKLKHCGFDAVETYCAWHLHEETEGSFDFTGRLDIVKFCQIAACLGLYVIVRPGPYICSECDFGALPGWLLGKPGLRIRCNEPVFLNYVERFYGELLTRLAPLQCTKGGPVIAMQVENEYGSYGMDKNYLCALQSIMQKYGIDVQLFTSDGADADFLRCGTLPDLPATINYRNLPLPNQKRLAAYDTGFPNAMVTTELWVGKGWHWNEQLEHHPAQAVAQDIRDIWTSGASVNCYMFHGGTNFGFTSGANFFSNKYCPLLTSYEVDAILDEGGTPTEKYRAVQKVMEEFRPGSTQPEQDNTSTAYPSFELTGFSPLADNLPALSKPLQSPYPVSMESLGQSFGFLLYRTTVDRQLSGTYLFEELRDRAIVMLDGQIVATVYRNEVQSFQMQVPHDGAVLDILVENMGRVCFGAQMQYETRGFRELRWKNRALSNWTIYPLPLKTWDIAAYQPFQPSAGKPGFYCGTFEIAGEPVDTYLKFPEGTRGYVQLNGFNLGRYWTIGPQRTLYVPAPLLRQGRNDVVVFELDGLQSSRLDFAARRILDPMVDMKLPEN